MAQNEIRWDKLSQDEMRSDKMMGWNEPNRRKWISISMLFYAWLYFFAITIFYLTRLDLTWGEEWWDGLRWYYIRLGVGEKRFEMRLWNYIGLWDKREWCYILRHGEMRSIKRRWHYMGRYDKVSMKYDNLLWIIFTIILSRLDKN